MFLQLNKSQPGGCLYFSAPIVLSGSVMGHGEVIKFKPQLVPLMLSPSRRGKLDPAGVINTRFPKFHDRLRSNYKPHVAFDSRSRRTLGTIRRKVKSEEQSLCFSTSGQPDELVGLPTHYI